MSRRNDRAGHELAVRAIRKDIDEMHGELFRIVMNHDEIAEMPNQFAFVGFNLHLGRLLFGHVSSVDSMGLRRANSVRFIVAQGSICLGDYGTIYLQNLRRSTLV